MDQNRSRALAERLGPNSAAPVQWSPSDLPEGALPLYGWVGVIPEPHEVAAPDELLRRRSRRRVLGRPGRGAA